MSSINSNSGIGPSFPIPDNASSRTQSSSKLGGHSISSTGSSKQMESAEKSWGAARQALAKAFGGSSSSTSSASLASRISTGSGGNKSQSAGSQGATPPPAPPLPKDLVDRINQSPVQLPTKSSSANKEKASQSPSKSDSKGFMNELKKVLGARGGNESVSESHHTTQETKDTASPQKLSLPEDTNLPFDPANNPPPLPTNFGSTSAASVSVPSHDKQPAKSKMPSSPSHSKNLGSGFMAELKSKLQSRVTSSSGEGLSKTEESRSDSISQPRSTSSSTGSERSAQTKVPTRSSSSGDLMNELKQALQKRFSGSSGPQDAQAKEDNSSIEEGPSEYPPVDYDESGGSSNAASTQSHSKLTSRQNEDYELPEVDYEETEQPIKNEAASTDKTTSKESSSSSSSKTLDRGRRKTLSSKLGSQVRKMFGGGRRKSK